MLDNLSQSCYLCELGRNCPWHSLGCLCSWEVDVVSGENDFVGKSEETPSGTAFSLVLLKVNDFIGQLFNHPL